jgi:hypothetical protein
MKWNGFGKTCYAFNGISRSLILSRPLCPATSEKRLSVLQIAEGRGFRGGVFFRLPVVDDVVDFSQQKKYVRQSDAGQTTVAQPMRPVRPAGVMPADVRHRFFLCRRRAYTSNVQTATDTTS